MSISKPPYIEKVEERGDLQVWVVDGSYIRSHIDEEFTNTGQHYDYSYIPENELWIDRGAKSEVFHLGHLWSQTPTTVTIYHDADRPSRLLLPITAGNIIGTFLSGDELSLKREA